MEEGSQIKNKKTKVTLDSPDGQALLKSASVRQTLLIRIFTTQEQDGYCGIQSSAMVMSARALGMKFPDPAQQSGCDVTSVPYVDYEMIKLPQTTRVITSEHALQHGATLKELQDLLASHSLPAQRVHADECSEQEFRSRAIEALSHSDCSRGVIVNFLYDTVHDDGSPRIVGHHSVLGAYNEDSDRFLVLDTWMIGQNEWYNTNDLFERMNTRDEEAEQNRGFLITG